MTILLHAIAAVLWALSFMFAAVSASRAERRDADAFHLGAVIAISLAAIAFTLQVLA